MASPFELRLPDGDQAVPLSPVPRTIGRGPTNDVVLADDTVSWHHAQVWLEGGDPWIRDLGSRNGTWRNDQRITGSAPLEAGDRIRIGTSVEVVLSGPVEGPVEGARSLHVEDVKSGVRLLVRNDRFRIGSSEDCDLRVEGWPDRTATILVHPDGELWVGGQDEAGERWETQIEPGEEFEIRGRTLRVVRTHVTHAPTVDQAALAYPYALTATANGAGGPQVVVVDPISGQDCLVTGNRGVLLFVLARRLAKDRDAGKAPAEEGWCTTQEVLTGVWGRGQKEANHLNVLVHRLRGQLEDQGFDPWFIEKRRGGIRVRCAEITVQ